MATNKTEIYVYALWQGMPAPKCIGIPGAEQPKGRNASTNFPNFTVIVKSLNLYQ
jgi:hypothetical protein